MFLRAAAPAGLASDSKHLIQNWRVTDGVPHNTIRSIIVAQNGYLWLGTANGLARFDGVRFVTFNRAVNPTMAEDDIFDLHEDRRGTIWYRTRRGIGRYEAGRFTFEYFLQDRGPFALLDSFVEDREGTLWVHGPLGLARWNGSEWSDVERFNVGTVGRLTAICPGEDEGFWLGTESGLWRMVGGQTTQVRPVSGLRDIALGNDGRLWVLADPARLFLLEEGRWSEMADFGGEPCYQLIVTSGEDVWLLVENQNVLYRYRDGQCSRVDESDGLTGNRVLDLMETPDGTLWAGSNAGGLHQIRDRRFRIYDRSDGLLSLNAASLCETVDGVIHLNVMGSTLHRFENDRFSPYDLDSEHALYTDPTAVLGAVEGGVWAGTFRGSLSRVEAGRVVERIGSDGGTRSLFRDREGRLWRGTRTHGVEVFAEGRVTRYSTTNGLSFDNVYCFAQDASGAVWVGTEDGLNRIHDGVVSRYGVPDGLGHSFISALWVDSRGVLWVGTLGGGLSGWHDGRFITIRTGQGLANDSVEQIVEDDRGNLWLGTRIGLMRIPLVHLHDYLRGNRTLVAGALLGVEHGLPNSNFWTEYQPSSLRDKEGALWFCTGSGVIRIRPEEFAEVGPPPVVQIEDVLVDGVGIESGVPGDEMLRIESGSERIQIRYTGISYNAPAQTRFRYRLIGYDSDWIDARTMRVAGYSHLPPRRYQFEVAAMNTGGVWSPANGSLSFVVLPSLWQSWWYQGALTVVVLSGFGLAYMMRVRGLEKRRMAQERFSRRLIDSQERERKRIAAELHDSLGQNLLVVRHLAAFGARVEGRDEIVAREFEEISTTAGHAINEVRAISHALRPIELDRLGLTKSIKESVRRMADASRVRFDSHIENIDRSIDDDKAINLYRIVQECLSNIVKHSEAKTASIEIRLGQGEVLMDIVDDGCGFDAGGAGASEDSDTGLGFSSIKERAGALGGWATIHSRPGGGTRVEVVIPIASRPTNAS